MQRTIRYILVLSLLNIASCGIIKDRSTEYADASSGNKLVVPDAYSKEKLRPRYPIPEIENTRVLPENFELPEPPNATAALNHEPFLIETVNDHTWLRLYTSPGKVWPLLDFFLSEYGLKVAHEEISQGFLVTKPYASIDGVASLHEDLKPFNTLIASVDGISFQAKLNQGVRRNTSELQIRALNVDSATEWQSASNKPELEQAMLSLIGQFITSDTLDDRYSLLANDIGGESRVRLLQDETGESYLELLLSFDRAWNEIGKALQSAEVIVSDFDRSEKTYFVSYIQEDDMSSWYNLSSSDEEKRKERNLSLQLEVTEDGKTLVRVKILNPEFEAEKHNELINVVFEHIS
mgnify:FL=1